MRIRVKFMSVIALTLAASPLASQTPAPQPRCQSAEHRQFDFWIGRWDVYETGTNELAGHSLIENLYGGCAIRENWMPLEGPDGGSLNSYRPRERRWRQSYTGAGNGWTDFFGGMEGRSMVLTATSVDANGANQLIRMTFTPMEDGAVRQVGTVSSDQGRSWQPSFDLTYRRSPAT